VVVFEGESPASAMGNAGDWQWRGNRDFLMARRADGVVGGRDLLERLAQVIDLEVFRKDLERVLSRSDRAEDGRPP
jgi:hypothetical protein